MCIFYYEVSFFHLSMHLCVSMIYIYYYVYALGSSTQLVATTLFVS